MARCLNLHLFVWAILFGVSVTEPICAKDRITWLFNDFAPAYILDRNSASFGQGYGEQTRAYFINRLPEFDHQIVELPLPRIFTRLASEDGLCTSTAIKTAERAKSALFSRQTYWLQPNRLIVRSANRQDFSRFLVEGRSVDLKQLLSATDLLGGILLSRPYGAIIDPLLAEAHIPNLVKMPDFGGLFKMLETHRVDWVIASSSEAGFYSRSLAQPVALASLPIVNEESLTAGYFACSNGPLGRKMVAALDKIISAAGMPPPYIDYYLKWLDAEARSDLLRSAFP